MGKTDYHERDAKRKPPEDWRPDWARLPDMETLEKLSNPNLVAVHLAGYPDNEGHIVLDANADDVDRMFKD